MQNVSSAYYLILLLVYIVSLVHCAGPKQCQHLPVSYHTQTTDSCYMCYILPYKLYNNLLFVKLNFKTFHGANISTQYFVVNDLICTISNLKSTYCMCTLQVIHDHMVCMHVYVRELVQVILLSFV